MRCVARLDEGGVELAGDAGGSWDLVLPGAVAQQLASITINHHLLTREEAQAHYERALHLNNRTPLSHYSCAPTAFANGAIPRVNPLKHMKLCDSGTMIDIFLTRAKYLRIC